MPNNLPPYFEKFLNDKFQETNRKIEELAKVKDDIKAIQRQVLWLVIAVTILFLLHIDDFGPIFLNSLRKFIGF